MGELTPLGQSIQPFMLAIPQVERYMLDNILAISSAWDHGVSGFCLSVSAKFKPTKIVRRDAGEMALPTTSGPYSAGVARLR